MYDIQKRFCKDQKLPIKIFQEPYFSDRLKLLNQYEAYCKYLDMIDESFDNNEQDYLEHYNKVKDRAIDFIKNSEAFQDINSVDMNQFVKKTNYPDTELYKEYNVGHKFISIDMAKANFTALVHYGLTFGKNFFPSYSYEEFIRQFTKVDHIVNSKYIRQVIFGNCNPKRQVAYESFLMEGIVTLLLSLCYINRTDVVALKSDEIVLLADDFDEDLINKLRLFVKDKSESMFPMHFEVFHLAKIQGSQAYLKQFSNGCYELKCVNPDEAPFLYRFLNEEDYQDSDFVFEYNDRLAKFLTEPKFEIVS